ncbi:MAG: TonB-dependent receptor [Piscinibacter sp.]|nr:TonB-dependent receptor [Piscinibacter sp.]
MHRIAAAAALAALHFGASAQTTSEMGKLPTVNVTAERRTENVQDIPNSVTTLNAEMIDILNTSGQDVRMLSGRVPSLNIESSFGRAFPRFYIRGYGNTDFRLNASQPVSLVYDDVVQENPILKGFPAFDLERIEVLRGPQGSLFGRNTPAGVVKFESVKPSTKRFEGYGSLSYGTFNTVNAEGAVNLPVTPGSALRLSVLNQTRDDWVENTYAPGPTQHLEGYRDSALRFQLLVESSKDLSVLGSVHARDFSGSARLFRANIIEPGTNNLVAGFDETKVSYDGKNESELQNYGASLRVRVGLGGMSLHSITGYEQVRTYSRGDIDGGFGASFLPESGPGLIPFASETADGIPSHRQITQEFRLESSDAAPLSWQTGLYFFHEDYQIESFSYDSLAGGAQDGYEKVRQKNNAVAVFGALNYAVTPAAKIRLGGRYTSDKKKFDVEAYTNSGFVPCVLSGKCTIEELAAQEPDGDLSASPKDSKFNWDLSGTYTVMPGTNLYARAATGFRGSSVQGAGAFNGKSVAGAETNTSYEAGIKTDLLGGRARVNFGIFHYTVKDLQLTAVGGASNANILLNAEKAVGQGFELDAQALLTDRLMVGLGVGYNDTKIKDPGLAVAVCAQCTVTDPTTTIGGTTYALIDGNPLPQAPKTTVNFMLKYSQPTPDGEWYVLTDWAYRSKVNFFLYESKEFTGKALTEGGVRLGYLWGNGKYEAALFGRNITNQIRIVGGIDFNNLTGFINEPRTWGAQFRATF